MIWLNYNQYKLSICENTDMLLHIMIVLEQFPIVAGILASPFSKYITLVANDFKCGSTEEELIVSFVHPFFWSLSRP